jgi:hypothetical protein
MKKLSITILVFAFAILTLSGCASKAGAIPKERPGDFDIRFSYWILPEQQNIYDTYEGTLQKDLVTNGTATADLFESNERLDEIYKKISELELYAISQDMTSENLTTTDQMFYVTPCTEYEIKFTIDGVEYTVTGDDTASNYIRQNRDADHFWQFKEFMQDLYRSSDEYQNLPKAEGAYD